MGYEGAQRRFPATETPDTREVPHLRNQGNKTTIGANRPMPIAN